MGRSVSGNHPTSPINFLFFSLPVSTPFGPHRSLSSGQLFWRHASIYGRLKIDVILPPPAQEYFSLATHSFPCFFFPLIYDLFTPASFPLGKEVGDYFCGRNLMFSRRIFSSSPRALPFHRALFHHGSEPNGKTHGSLVKSTSPSRSSHNCFPSSLLLPPACCFF